MSESIMPYTESGSEKSQNFGICNVKVWLFCYVAARLFEKIMN